MGSKYVREALKRGVSDLIIVLALISVAVPITLALQHWLTFQVGRATTYSVTPKVTTSIVSMDYRNSSFTAVIEVVNRGVDDVNISNINATVLLANGTNITTALKIISGRGVLSPNDRALLLLTIPNITSKAVLAVLEFKDVSGSLLPVELVIS